MKLSFLIIKFQELVTCAQKYSISIAKRSILRTVRECFCPPGYQCFMRQQTEPRLACPHWKPSPESRNRSPMERKGEGKQMFTMTKMGLEQFPKFPLHDYPVSFCLTRLVCSL